VALPDAAGQVQQLAQSDAERGPEIETSPWPVDRSVPIDRNQSTPPRTIPGTEAMDSTLLTTVGRAYRPATAGNGGLSRGWPRRPSKESSSAVSSPQM